MKTGVLEKKKNYFKFLFNRSESITALLLPEDMLPGTIDNKEVDSRFKNYLSILELFINCNYGEGFEMSMKNDYLTRTGSFKRNELTIDYSFHKLSGITMFSMNDGIPRDVIDRSLFFGELTIKENVINKKPASELLKNLTKDWLLAYESENKEFMIFHYSGKKILDEGKSLMSSLNLHPEKAAEY